MPKPSLSETYAIVAAIVLLFLVMLGDPVTMLVVSLVGLVAGIIISRRVEVKRSATVAAAAFAIVVAFALYQIIR